MQDKSIKSPLVFDIARGSFDDGPGIRTVVFLKGCPLRCLWCQNPESQRPGVETFFYPEKCIDCGDCEGPLNGSGKCDSLARQIIGRYYSPQRLARLILRDKVFYETSGGGVTFSGGEPLLHLDYLYEVARLLKVEQIHMAVETCGYFDYEKFAGTLLPYIDLFLFDIKILDPGKHKAYTGKSNEIILQNFEKLLTAGKEVQPRIPLIPGFTATEENLSQIAGFLASLKDEAGADNKKIKEFVLLPYNPSGLDKWKRLRKEKPKGVSSQPTTIEEEQKWLRFFKKRLKRSPPETS
ncbi:MAG: radical SAM protein [Candidatus Aminicenantes bacterium]|nr:radical SAM protein [Candidatus Aminicenantes bacterium]